jgi:hypothetical protein
MSPSHPGIFCFVLFHSLLDVMADPKLSSGCSSSGRELLFYTTSARRCFFHDLATPLLNGSGRIFLCFLALSLFPDDNFDGPRCRCRGEEEDRDAPYLTISTSRLVGTSFCINGEGAL